MFHVEQNDKLIEISNCPICSGDNISLHIRTRDFFFSQEEFSISCCSDCNFKFTNPVPSDLAMYYDTKEYLSHNTDDNGFMGKLYSTLRNINIKRKYRLVSNYCKKGNILDIGCGTGELLNYFNRNSWSVKGIEPNMSAREFANSNYNLNIFEEKELDKFSSQTFDVISMWHVLEHVQDLHNRLKQLSRLLKNDGTILIALPNLSSPDSIKYKEYWSALDVPRHLWHFTQKTFELLISMHNMKLIHAEPMKFDSYYVSMLSEKYLKNRLFFPAAILNGFRSNIKAKKENNYSSMIFVVKKL